MTIYSLFKEKITSQPKNQQYRVIFSFKDLSNREKFLEKNKDLKFLGKIDFIPSIYLNLEKAQIINYEKAKLVEKIEEDQKLFLSMLDVLEVLEINDYKNSQISYTGKKVNVGIIDDGINKNFTSISNINSKQYFLNEIVKDNDLKNIKKEITHGTIMASVISNRFKNVDDNYIGIAPNVNYIDFNISNSDQKYYFSNILQVFDKIIKENIDIDILLISLITKDCSDGKDILSLACDQLVNKGIIIICPAGNFGPDPYTIGSPGAAEKVFTIGALTKNLTIPNFSGRGPTLDNRTKPNIYFHGSNVIIPLSNNLRLRVSGTSVSASIGVGLIALIKEFDPKITYNDIIGLIKKSRINLNYDPKDQGLGSVKITDLFRELDLYHEKLSTYNYLTKRSLILSIECLIVFIIIFYFFYFFNSWQF
ncbi:MAG: S8 family serine peptidase [Candidatus Lokiarchaeota archaeon]|nr:S8 family serine peptidase [Candidatus Lokiarchaeota archaeon]